MFMFIFLMPFKSESAIQAAVFTLMDSALSQIISPQENDFHLRQNPQNHLHSEEYKELELLQNLDPEEVIQVVDTLLYHPLLPNTSLRHLLKVCIISKSNDILLFVWFILSKKKSVLMLYYKRFVD